MQLRLHQAKYHTRYISLHKMGTEFMYDVSLCIIKAFTLASPFLQLSCTLRLQVVTINPRHYYNIQHQPNLDVLLYCAWPITPPGSRCLGAARTTSWTWPTLHPNCYCSRSDPVDFSGSDHDLEFAGTLV